jgi:endonuclease G
VPSFTGMVLHKKAYYLSYLTDKKIAEWVAYPLTKEIIVKGNFERSGYFEVDPELGNKQAGYYDFSSSGYIRGHLVPVADVSYDLEAMKQSYLLSNIAPMNASFNEGVWFDLEKTIRDWAYRYRHIYVVTGPILNNAIKYIGKGKIAAPSAYFKAVWIEDDVHPRAIGFVLENSARSQSIQESIISIDDLEFITKLDLFPEIVEDDDESRIESTLDVTSFIWMKPINNSSQ